MNFQVLKQKQKLERERERRINEFKIYQLRITCFEFDAHLYKFKFQTLKTMKVKTAAELKQKLNLNKCFDLLLSEKKRATKSITTIKPISSVRQ